LWTKYHELKNTRGQIYFIRGNIRIQIVTDEKIYFYIIDKETCEPKLENVMYNFMQCSQLMFGARVRYGIAYKTNQPGFQIYTRKFYHNFKVAISNENFEGARGGNLGSMGAYVMCEKTRIGIYNQDTYEPIQQWNVPTKSQKDEIQILYMTISHDQTKIGVALGKALIKERFEITEIAIYKKGSNGKFGLEKLRDFDDKDSCIQFSFNLKNSCELLFFTREELYSIDYVDEAKDRVTVYSFENQLGATPKFGEFNKDQSKFIVTSAADVLYVDIKKG